MNIVKIFDKFRDKESMYKSIYGINIAVKDKNMVQSVFIDTTKILDANTMWIDINKLNNEEFLKEHGIEYILESEDKNIIPIGLVDFTNQREYCSYELNIWNRKEVELYKSNQIIKNIERAIEIKYEAVKFIKRFDTIGSSKVEDTNLDFSLDDLKLD